MIPQRPDPAGGEVSVAGEQGARWSKVRRADAAGVLAGHFEQGGVMRPKQGSPPDSTNRPYPGQIPEPQTKSPSRDSARHVPADDVDASGWYGIDPDKLPNNADPRPGEILK